MVEKKKLDRLHRPKETHGTIYKITVGCGSAYVTPARNDDGILIEIFATLGKAGGCATCQLEALTRSISLGLKYRVPLEEYVKELEEIKCPSPGFDNGGHYEITENRIHSCADAIATILKKEIKKEKESNGKVLD